jgi:hypothetical protein
MVDPKPSAGDFLIRTAGVPFRQRLKAAVWCLLGRDLWLRAPVERFVASDFHDLDWLAEPPHFEEDT